MAPSSRIISTSMPSRRPRSATRSRGSGKAVADGIEDGAARQHQIGALDADAIIAGALLIAHAKQPRDGRGDIRIAHPDAVDPAAVVAQQIEMDAGQRRHRAGGAEQVHARKIGAMLGRERGDVLRDLLDHASIGLRA